MIRIPDRNAIRVIVSNLKHIVLGNNVIGWSEIDRKNGHYIRAIFGRMSFETRWFLIKGLARGIVNCFKGRPFFWYKWPE